MVELIGRNTGYGRFPIDETLLNHLGGNSNCSNTRALAIASLKHVKFFVLYGKLEILHVLKMLLELLLNGNQTLKGFRKRTLELGDGPRGTNTSHHVFSLSIGEEFTIKHLLAASGITSKPNA